MHVREPGDRHFLLLAILEDHARAILLDAPYVADLRRVRALSTTPTVARDLLVVAELQAAVSVVVQVYCQDLTQIHQADNEGGKDDRDWVHAAHGQLHGVCVYEELRVNGQRVHLEERGVVGLEADLRHRGPDQAKLLAANLQGRLHGLDNVHLQDVERHMRGGHVVPDVRDEEPADHRGDDNEEKHHGREARQIHVHKADEAPNICQHIVNRDSAHDRCAHNKLCVAEQELGAVTPCACSAEQLTYQGRHRECQQQATHGPQHGAGRVHGLLQLAVSLHPGDLCQEDARKKRRCSCAGRCSGTSQGLM
mmetsp:Transcript_102059/g.318969  ORF Transcript_102059/g.318969 Transcript_102059/m.318969 type:complete len:309 (-) Transcript_102059:114-1040(-)